MTEDRGRRPPVRVPLYLTGLHECAYFPERQAQTLFLDPLAPLNGPWYQRLLDQGFRRSGGHVYRPSCPACSACVSVRIPVKAFRPNRSQRRNLGKNRGRIRLVERPARFDPTHYELYEHYVQTRHPEGSMAQTSPEEYHQFLLRPWGGETRLFEFRLEHQLIAVAVTDVLPHGLSAVYTFFEPAHSALGPGMYAILWQIAKARETGLPYLYLGYWINDCPKMNYKERYRPIEAWSGREWLRFHRGEPIAFGA
jgi:arginine-tRNA-protein transferase